MNKRAVGVANKGFAALSAYTSWIRTLLLPIEGGLWFEGSIEVTFHTSHHVTPYLSHFQGSTTVHHVKDTIDFTGTQLQGERWFVEAKELVIHSAFGSYQEKSSAYGGKIIIPIAGVMVPTMEGHMKVEKITEGQALYAHIMMEESIVMSIQGKAAFEGVGMEAASLKLNVGELLLKSIASVGKKDSKSFSVSLDPLAMLLNPLSIFKGGSFEIEKGDKEWIDEMTRLVGRERVEIVVSGMLEVAGAMIASATRNEAGRYVDNGNMICVIHRDSFKK